MRPVRIGILGAAKVAPYALLTPARETGVAEVVMVAASSRARAVAFAAIHGVGAVADDYEALIADPRVEAIYNALPPSRHADLTIMALKAGKPVLCEKPFCITLEEARAMADAAHETGVPLMEAMHARYHPQIARAQEIIAAGEIGELQRIVATYDSPIPETPDEFRFRPELGGGALLDTGVYCLGWCRAFAGDGAQVVSARAQVGASGVDETTWAELAFPTGVTAQVRCSIRGPIKLVLELVGSKGSLTIRNPVAPQFFPSLIQVGEREEAVTSEATYNFQLRAFAAAVRDGAPVLTGPADSVAQMELIDAIRRQAAQAA